MQETAEKFKCELCNFSCSRQSNFNTHLMTKKHIKMQKDMPVTQVIITPPSYDNDKVYCVCGKKYANRSGLSYHLKRCTYVKNEKKVTKEKQEKNEEVEEPNIDFLKNTIKDLLEQNKQYVKIIENSNHKVDNSINHNINGNVTVNQTRFNLNFFLNEECKDAVNITDYVDAIELTITDLEQTARLGYIDGISKIINDRIKEIDLTSRPYHCTDVKREIVYVKDKDIWEKENSDKPKMKRMITTIINKNLQQLTNWKNAHPECNDLSNEKGEEYLNLMIEANGGQEREKKEEKILKNIMREAIL
jgi:predicted ester cyclase